MSIPLFIVGLAHFTLGTAVALESRRATNLTLGRQLRWLAAFGIVQGLSCWTDLFSRLTTDQALVEPAHITHAILIAAAAMLLMRYGVGVLSDAGPLPRRLILVPLAFVVPGSILGAYVLVVSLSGPQYHIATEVWSRYLLYLPGCLVATAGFLRHRAVGSQEEGHESANAMLAGAAGGFLTEAVFSGLVVPGSPFLLGPWLNYETVLELTGVPIELWRTASAVLVAFFVIRSLDLFEASRLQSIEDYRQKMLRVEIGARQHAERWTHSLVLLNKMIASLSPVDEVLEQVVALATELHEYDSAGIALWDDNNECLRVKAAIPEVDLILCPPVQDEFLLRVARSRALVMTSPGHRFHDPIHQHTEPSTVAAAPLLLDGVAVGVLWAALPDTGSSQPDDSRTIGYLADHAVIALEHASMASQLQSVAVSKERLRIARDMHDGLSQLLAFLSMEMQTFSALAKQRRRADLLEELRLARDRINEAQTDLRENILSLRTTLSEHIGLVQALEEYIAEFADSTGIEVELRAQDTRSGLLSPLAEVQVVCIIQEALTNIRKHAQATRVSIRMSTAGDVLCVTIDDNGNGFPAKERQGHFGLQTMRERAEEIGGLFSIDSSPGSGTQVRLISPIVVQPALALQEEE